MQRAGLIGLCLIILCIPFLSCATDDIPVITEAQVKTWVADSVKSQTASLKSDLDKKATTEDLASAKKKADDAYGLAEDAMAKAKDANGEIDTDAFISGLTSTQVTALKTKLGISGSSSSSSSNSSNISVDNEVDNNKDLVLYLTDINPSMDSLLFSTSQSVRMEFAVENLDDSSHTYEITIYMYPTQKENNYGINFIDSASDIDGIDIYSDNTIKIGNVTSYLVNTGKDDPVVIKLTTGWVGSGDITEFDLLFTIKVEGSAEFNYNYNIWQKT